MAELYLMAVIAGRDVAIASSQVDSVVDVGTIVPVPGAPAHVVGLAALRSRVVTVIDAAAALGEPSSSGKRAVIVTAGGHVYAVLVDRVDDVASFVAERLPEGVALRSGWANAARGTVANDGSSMLIVDPVALIGGTVSTSQPMAA